jgi:hypothetical protein
VVAIFKAELTLPLKVDLSHFNPELNQFGKAVLVQSFPIELRPFYRAESVPTQAGEEEVDLSNFNPMIGPPQGEIVDDEVQIEDGMEDVMDFMDLWEKQQ